MNLHNINKACEKLYEKIAGDGKGCCLSVSPQNGEKTEMVWKNAYACSGDNACKDEKYEWTLEDKLARLPICSTIVQITK